MAWTRGAVCNGVTDATHVQDILRGRHVVAGECDYAPFGMPSTTHASGWSGIDISIMDRLSTLLGFTYEIREFPCVLSGPNHTTWTDILVEAANNNDVVLNYWDNQPERWDHGVLMLPGHYGNSYNLVSNVVARQNDAWYRSFYSYMDPFDFTLWFALGGVVLFSGVVDFLVERKHVDTKLTASLYEYAAGLMWGGFEYPLSKFSAIYQLILGFFVLVIVSSYTANLASFITISARPTAAVSRLDDAVSSNGRIGICADASDSSTISMIGALSPRHH